MYNYSSQSNKCNKIVFTNFFFKLGNTVNLLSCKIALVLKLSLCVIFFLRSISTSLHQLQDKIHDFRRGAPIVNAQSGSSKHALILPTT